ncbi:MAG TPA: Crp/Fnr family transcriptional regulator [Gemmatimonadaceae bacterium]|nr:Crp/Fnr family transcriptional regulator [Gemmatimonadaceae bacterium]
MNAPGHDPAIEGNRLLSALVAEDRERLLGVGEIVLLTQKQTIYEPNAPQTHVYFPGECVISLITMFNDGGAVEVGTIGCEGMAGLPLFLDATSAPVLVMVQLPGNALRVEAAEFTALVQHSPRARATMGRYAQAFLSQVLQTAACNGHHQIVPRCARWLLMTHDRVGAQQFALTHELLAYMLGVRRAGVTEAAGELQQAGYIRYGRGRVEIVDRAGLESAACECYGTVRKVYEELVGTSNEKSSVR